MNEKEQKYLFDILNAIREIEDFLGTERSFNVYQANSMLRSAVERQLTIIGEAINRILAQNPTIAISAARNIVQFRNKITHEYDAVDDVVVWAIIIKHLPELKTEVENLLQK